MQYLTSHDGGVYAVSLNDYGTMYDNHGVWDIVDYWPKPTNRQKAQWVMDWYYQQMSELG